MAGWWEDYKKRKGLSSGDSGSQSGKTYSKRMTTDEHRQAAKSSTWWEDYKKKNDLERRAAADRQRAAQSASRLKYRSERNQRFASANRQLDENRSRDAAEDEIRELFRNPFSSDAEWQAGVLQRNAERYKRDLPLYQQAMQNSSTWGEYFSAHRQAGESQSAVKHQFERYQQAAQKAEQDRNESNLVNRPALYASEHMTPEQISAELDRLRSGAATPTVTDKDRNDPVYAYMYPDAVLRKDPHGARFDERLLEGAGQDAIDALYRPILTEQEKAAVEEADRKIIEDKANRNYERVQILKAAQSMQTERTSRETGNQLMEEIATGGAAAKQVETGRAAFEAKQQQIASETSFEIGDDLDSNRGAYNKMQKERRERGYIMGADWDNVPEARKQAVYALYAQDPEKAMELAKYYIADARQAEDEEKQAWYAQNGWTAALGLVSSAAAHLGAAVDPFGDVGQELTRRGDNALAGGSQWADAATGYQKIPEWVPIVGGKGAGDFYQTVGSVVQSAAVAAPAILVGRYDKAAAETIGKLGLVLMGSSAAASDYRESVAAGMDEDRAKLHALAAGVEEALFEEVSLDKLIKMDTSGGLKAALKNWLVQSGIEGSEELATSIANRITDEMISGAGQSKVERRASELIANGMNSTEAHTQAESEWMTDTLYEGFSGFLSGGMMTGGNYALKGLANLKERAVNAAETRKAQKQAGAAVSRSEGSVEALQAYAKDNGIEIKSVETAEQSAEQGGQKADQNSYSASDYRSISDTNSKVVQSIRNEVRGKTAQEQQAIRDSLVEKYGEGIAPAVYNAISVETASRVRQEYGNVDSIQAARNQAVSEIKDESLRRAVSDGYDSAAYSLAASQGGEGGMNTMSRYIQQRNNTGTGEMSMNATVTAQDGSTKTISITGMSEDGKRVSLADGSEVAVKDLQADADTTSAIQQLADLDLGADATKVLQAYQQSGVAGTEGYRWLMDYATAYNQGRTRQISLEQAAQRSSLDERTVMDAYTLGQQAANRETLAGLEKLKNLPKRKGASGRTANIDTTEIKGKTMSKSELEQFALANQYAQALGVDMTWFSSKEQDGKFVGKNGAYENGKIYMDIHAGRNFAADLTSGILATMGHELTHFQQQYAPEEYQALKEFLFEQIVKSSPNGEARLERLIWEKQRRSGYTLSRKAAEDEVVADACQKMLRDSKAVHDFANQQPEAANGVVRWLDKWFKKVRSIFGRGGNYSEEAQLMDSLEQDVKAAFGELWDKALKQAVKVHDEVGNIEKTTTEGESNEESEVQNSDRPNTDSTGRELSEGQQEYFKDSKIRDKYGNLLTLYHGTASDFTVFDLGRSGKNYDGWSEYGIGIYLTPDKKFATYFSESASQRGGTPKLMELYVNIKNPFNVNDPVTVDVSEYAKKYKLTEDDVKFLKKSGDRWLAFMREHNEDIYDFLTSHGYDGLWDAYGTHAPTQIVAFTENQVKNVDNHNPTDNPDIRYSDRDTEYLELAKDPEKNAARLQEMVDEAADQAGYTIKAYHGTREDFTVFDKSKFGDNFNGYSQLGGGFYFAMDEDEAKKWANRAFGKGNPRAMSVYLRGQNMLSADEKISSAVAEKALLNAGIDKSDIGWYLTRPERFVEVLRFENYSPQQVQDLFSEMGYDGVYEADGKRTQFVVFNPEQIKSADPVTYDDSGNVIPLSERFNEANEDIRFSMREPVEQTDRLIALHNLSAEKLSKALALGGFPMPSIAVTKTSIPHTNFGPITLVMDKSTIDPMQDRRNTVYSADAWTPTFPSVEYEVNEKVESRLRRKYYDLEKKFGRDAADPLYPWGNYAEDELNRRGGPEEVIDRYHDDTDMMKLFLLDSGLSVPENVKEVQVKRMDDETIEFYDLFVNEMGKDVFEELKPREGETIPETRKRWWAEHGEEFESVYRKYMKDLNFSDEEISNVLENETISSQTRKALQMRNYIRTGPETRNETVNVTATNAAIRAAVDAEQYDAWLHGLFDGLVKSRGIYNGKDRFTPSGNSRSFASTHYSVTLENIAKAMAAQNDGNSRNVSGFYGVKSLRAGLAKRFSSIAEMHKYEGRLQHLTEEQAKKINDALADRLSDVTARIYNSVPHSDYDSYFIAIDSIGNDLMEITEQKNITKESIQRVLSKYGYKISDTLAEDIRTLLFDVSQMPVNIYEAKPERAVRFDEVLAAIVPTDTDKALLEKLRDAGVQNLIEYKAGDDSDRLAKVNSVEGAKFSERDYSTPSDEELLMSARVEDAANVEQGRLLKEYQALGKRITTLEKQLAEARRQTQLTNRALNTRGIGNVVKTVMKDYDITDARHNGTAKNATIALTDGYQKALDLLDKGASPADVNDAVYNGAVQAAEIILEQGTYSQNIGGKWQVYSASRYLGENSQELIDSFVSEAYADFVSNRYREARPETAADRLVARTKKEAQERVDKYKGRSDALAEANRRLEEKTTQAETEAKEARKAAGELFLEIKDLRQELLDNKTLSEQERKAASKKLKDLNTRLEAKREEASSWQKRAKRNASLLKSALESKSRDISALNDRLSKEQEAALEKQKRLEAKLEKQIQRERDILAGKLRAPGLAKLLKAEREKAEAQVKKQKEAQFASYKERKKAGDLRGRIKNLSDEMKRRMTNPTDRAYVPASLYQSMTKLADVLDNVLSPNLGTKAEARYRAMMDAIRGMAREYEDVKNLDPVFASEYEQEISDAIGEIERILERKNASWIDNLTGDTQKSFAELNSDELQQLYDLMRQINYTITNATKVFGNSNYKSIFDAQRAVAEQQNSMKSLNAVSRLERKKRLRLLNSLSVMRATEMMAGWDRSAALYQLMHGIEQGADDAWAWVMDYNKSMQDLKTGKNEKEYRQALTKQLDFGITDRDGLKVTMTKMQALQILMTAEREEHNDKLLHLQAGGAVIRNATDLQNGKGAKARSQTISVTPELIQKINDSLTEWDRAYMKTVRDYFRREGKRTNEILYKLKHKVLKTEEFYVPYTVDRNYLEANLNEQQALNMWVKTPGSTNALKQKAKQPVIIDGMDTVMGQHVKEIGNYIGMAIPIRDFSKVYNGMIPTEGPNPLPVKETIERTFGKAGQHLLTQAVIDVQGGTARQNWESNIAQFLNKLQGAFVKSALLINPSVTIKQAASYIAAESVISHLALERGNHSVWARTDESKSFMPGGLIAQLFARPEGKTAQRIYNEIDQHTSLHYQRRQGMSMAEIAEQANRTGPIKRRINAIGASMEQSKIGHAVRRTGENLNPITWIQRMDVATTAALWVACKEQAKLDKLAVGSEEFWKRTTELYERCIRETQPMYDGLHRTANQKQAGGLMQYLFPFRTVPIQNHGQLAASYEAYKAARESKNEAKIKEAGKFFRKTAWAQTESAFVFSVMTFLAAILKRKTKKYRDEEGEFDAGSLTKGLLTDVGSTLISVLNPMYGSELFNLGSRAVDKFEGNSGYTYDAFSVGVVDMINDLASSGDRLLADAGKIVRGENVNTADFWNHALNLLLKGGKLAGIPADTVKTYFEGTKGNIQDAIEGRIPALNDESWERTADVNARRYMKAIQAGDTEKAEAVMEEMRENYKEEKPGLSEKAITRKVRNALASYIKEQYTSKEISEEDAISYLVDYTGKKENDAFWQIREWEAKKAHKGDAEYTFSPYEHLRELIDNGKDLTGEIAYLQEHGKTASAINSDIKKYIRQQFDGGELNEQEAMKMLQKYHKVKDDRTGKYRNDTENEAWFILDEWKAGIESEDDEEFSYEKYRKLYSAMDNDDDASAAWEEMSEHGVSDDTLKKAVSAHLQKQFQAGEISEDVAIDRLQNYRGMDEDEAYWQVDKWRSSDAAYKAGEDFNESNYRDLYAAIDGNKDPAAAMKELTSHGYKESDVYTQAKKYLSEKLEKGEITEQAFKNKLSRYCKIVKAEEVDDAVQSVKNSARYKKLMESKPNLDATESQVNAWYDGTANTRNNGHESAKTAGMSIENYIKAKTILADVKDANGNRTGEDEYIAALTKITWLTPRQKDALYYERYKGTTKYSHKTW